LKFREGALRLRPRSRIRTAHSGSLKFTEGALSLLAALMLVALTAACAGRTEYGDATAVETLTVDFGSTDLQMIADKMVQSLLGSSLVQQGHSPVVLVDRVRNKTDEHIDTKAVTDKIRTALLQSGKVRFAAGEVRDEVVRELEFQAGSGYVEEASRKRLGKLVGPGYLLTGEITNIRKQAGRKTDVYFLMTLNLVELETGLIPWSENQEIRKKQKTPLVGW